MNLKAFHTKLFFKQLFVISLLLIVFTQSVSKVAFLITDSNYEIALLDWDDNSEEEQQQEDDTKNEKTQILYRYNSHLLSIVNGTKLVNISENISENILREVHSPPPDLA